MKRGLAVLLSLPLNAMAAESAAPSGPSLALGSGMAGQLTQTVLGLLLVLGLIFALAWLLRRMQQGGSGNAQVIELVGSRTLGPRDRLVLVQVGSEQILLGLSAGRITPLHVLKQPVDVSSNEKATPEFAQRLLEMLGKDHKDKS